MGFEYANVHLYYNIPPAIFLTVFYRPFFSKLDAYKILFLITIAVTATLPWDSHLIKTRVWTYPEHAIIGPKLFEIPIEEVFFFVVQTYNTSMLYLILSKPTFRPAYIRHEDVSDKRRWLKSIVTLCLTMALKRSFSMLRAGREGTYMALILLWALPFVVLLWNLAYQFIIGLPWTETVLPITLPTLYLWIVDTLALQRGTWVIESGTKLGINLWPSLEIEEALFFLLTNTMIVFGLIAFDNAVAVLDTFESAHTVASHSALPSPLSLVRALLLPAAKYDKGRLEGLQQAVALLRRKSRSFYLASSVFERGLRIDLIILYSFCRVADDLVDTAKSREEAQAWIEKLRSFLDTAYGDSKDKSNHENIAATIRAQVLGDFPAETQFALLQLPTYRLPSTPLYDLLKGFETDLEFNTSASKPNFPIETEHDLDTYGQRVAGTVAVLCLAQVWTNYPTSLSASARQQIESAGANMGIALQYVNIARDLALDAQAGRLYVPTAWVEELGLSPPAVLSSLASAEGSVPISALLGLRTRLLDRAFALYEDARPAMERLPPKVRPGMRVAVESYMEIGRTLRARTRDWSADGGAPRIGDPLERTTEGTRLGNGAGRATVALSQRLVVAYRALSR